MRRFWQPRWQIGILKNSLIDVVEGADLEYEWIESPYRDGWMADPFVLSVSEEEVELLVEDFRYKDQEGRISKVTVNRQRSEITNRKVLIEGGHYSFPAILRKGEKIFVYPEQSRQRKLDIFEYNRQAETCSTIRTLCKKTLSDAVIHDGWFYFTAGEGHTLQARNLSSDDVENFQIEKEKKAFMFDENIARNAGDFFAIDDVVYRPAQECNRWYGNAVSIQRFENEKFTEVRRIPGIHTLNSYQGITVVDRKIFPFKWLYWLLGRSDK